MAIDYSTRNPSHALSCHPSASKGSRSCEWCLRKAVIALGMDWGQWQENARRKEKTLATQRRRARIKQDPQQYQIYLQQERNQVALWKQANPEKQKLIEKRAYQKGRSTGKIQARQKKRRNTLSQEERKKQTAAVQKTRKKYPEKYRAMDCVGKARRRAATGHFTAEQWIQMKALYGYRCVYCGKKFQALTMDHVVPLSKDGSHTWENIVPACRSCNSRKHARKAPPHQPMLPFFA